MNKQNDKLLHKLFFSILPIQILIYAMDSVNSIVDGVMAGRFIDAETVGVIGLYYTMVEVYSAIGIVCIGGASVLCGKYIGRGEQEKTEGIFSLDITLTFIVGGFLTLICLVFPDKLALILGANENLKESLILYIIGIAFGILPFLLSKQIALFLQLEGQSKRNYIGLAIMTVSNVILDIVLVAVLRLGVFGLALATSISDIIYLLVISPYFLTKKASLHFSFKKAAWDELALFLKTGLPGALLVFSIALRYLAVNRILLHYCGSDGLSALSAFNMVAGIYISFCLGNGSVVRMLVSVFIGEEDRDSIKEVVKIVLTKGMIMILIISAILLALAPTLAYVFFPDRTSNVYHLASQILAVYTFCLPFILICQLFTNYLQAMGHRIFIDIQSVFDGFFSVTVPAAILAPIFGAMGVWISNLIGVILVILTVPIYAIIYWKGIPKNLDEWMFFEKDFGAAPEDSLSITINNMKETSDASENISIFCRDHNMRRKTEFFSALCLEEMAGNVIRHGFDGKKENNLNVRAVYSPGKLMIRLKDNCRPFNPGEMAEIVSRTDENEFKNIGIKMVYKVADDVNYQNMLGLNVLSIVVNEGFE